MRGRIRMVGMALLLGGLILGMGRIAYAQSLEEAQRLNTEVLRLLQSGKYPEAIPLATRALAIREQVLGTNHPDVAISLNNLALLYKSLGAYHQAEPLYKRSLAILEQVLGTNHPHVAVILNNLALLYKSLGAYHQAEPLAQRALAIREQVLGTTHSAVAESLNNLALLYQTLGAYSKAEPLYQRSLAIYEQALGTTHPAVAQSLNNLAGLYQTLGAYHQAEPLYKRALAIREQALGTTHPAVAESLNNLAALYLESGRLEEGFQIVTKQDVPMGLGKYYLLKQAYGEAEAQFRRSQGRKTERPDFLIANLLGLGLALEGQGKLAQAEAQFRQAVDLLEGQWVSLSPVAKKSFLTGAVGVGFKRLQAYEALIRVQVKQQQASAALLTAERVKGRMLLEMLAARALQGRKPADAAILQQERALQQALLTLRAELQAWEQSQASAASSKRTSLQQALTAKEKEYVAFLEGVKDPALASLIRVSPISLEQIQAKLDPQTTLVEYYTALDQTYVWLLTRQSLTVLTLPVTEKALQQTVTALLLPNLSTRPRKPLPTMVLVPHTDAPATSPQQLETNRTQFVEQTHALYWQLIAPWVSQVKTSRLLIVPHGVLHKVPFAALGEGEQLLLDRYELAFLPSASTLAYLSHKPGTTRSLLGLANPITEAVPLKFAEVEVDRIAPLFSTRQLYRQQEATETLLKRKAGQSSVLHLATHGEFHESQPLLSGLRLTQDQTNDGRLEVHEFFGLDLQQTQLVTLSACETGLGTLQGGDDLVGLSRGVFYAGAPSLVATLWQVDDPATAQLMQAFYTAWMGGQGLSASLRQAQLALKAKPEFRHPYYWAPFILMGEWR